METQKTIKGKYLPVRWPISFTLVLYLLLDKFHASGMVKGVVWTIMGFVWVVVLISEWHQKAVEFKDLMEK